MYGLDVDQFRRYIVEPTLETIDMADRTGENLVLGTALKESKLIYLKQLGNGPALGLFQMETATHDDIWRTYLNSRPALVAKLKPIIPDYAYLDFPPSVALQWNLAYATAMCRIKYLRAPAALPSNEPLALAEYWKRWYNTADGKGEVDEALIHFKRACI